MKTTITTILLGIFMHSIGSAQLEAYPFISDLYANCDNLSFEEHDLGAFSFIYVSDGTLYFEDGTKYCSDSENMDCRALYDLSSSTLTKMDQCSPTGTGEESIQIVIPDVVAGVGESICVDVEVSGLKNILSFSLQISPSNSNVVLTQASSSVLKDFVPFINDNSFKLLWVTEDIRNQESFPDNTSLFTLCMDIVGDQGGVTNLIIPPNASFPSEFILQNDQSLIRIIENIELTGGIIRIIDEDSAEINSNLPTDRFEWFSNSLSDFDCSSLTITEYDLGAFSFLHFEDKNGSQLFFEDGTFYCQDSEMRDCRSLYDLNEETIANRWACSQDDIEDDEPIGGNISEQLEESYPWISSVISCENNEVVIEYESSIFHFIYVESKMALYFEDGTFYCQGSESQNCLELYGLSEASNRWVCGDNLVDKSVEYRNAFNPVNKVAIFPNPSNGIFVINSQNDITAYAVRDLTGRLIKSDKSINASSLTLDLTAEEGQFYFLTLFGAESMVSYKLVKQ